MFQSDLISISSLDALSPKSVGLNELVVQSFRRNEIESLMAKYVGQEHTMYLKICIWDCKVFVQKTLAWMWVM